jgi:Glycosyltransferase family 87
MIPIMLTFDRESIDARLSHRITLFEWLATGMLLAAAFFLSIVRPWPYDFLNYLNVANGNFNHYYYAYWFVPIFQLLARMPVSASYFLWNLINIGSLLWAARVFGGRSILLLAAFQTFYILVYGQITGIIIGALALVLWGLAHEKPWAAGLGIVIACTKYQIGLPAALAIWIFYGESFTNRMRSFILPVVISLLSLVVYPWWPLRVLETIRNFPPNDWGSITLWRWLGPLSLVFWLPPFLLPLTRERRLLALIAAIPLAVPYFQQTDLLLLFALPVGWLPLLGDLGVLYKPVGWWIMPVLAAIPLIAYGLAIVPGLQSILHTLIASLNRNQVRG